MSIFEPRPEYDVALSFAGEQREYVQAVARAIAGRLRVFYDEYEQTALWGKNLYEHLDHVYRNASRYCVLFISKEYAAKVYPTHERRSAQARALVENTEYILPVRFDATEVPGLPPTVGYIDATKITPEELAALLCEKVQPSPLASGDHDIAAIQRQAVLDPRGALQSVAHLFEGEVRALLAVTHWAEGGFGLPVAECVAWLERHGLISRSVALSMPMFEAEIDRAAERDDLNIRVAIEVGIGLLRAVQAIPREINTVLYPGVPVYEDEACERPRDGIVGVVLQTVSPGATTVNPRIFPVRTEANYRRGAVITWEWERGEGYGETWYRDPESNGVTRAWSGSMLFAGRHLDEVLAGIAWTW